MKNKRKHNLIMRMNSFMLLGIGIVAYKHSYAADGLDALSNQVDPSNYLLKVFFGLSIVVLSILLCAFLLKKMNNFSRGMSENIKVLSIIGVGPKEKLVLVSIEKKELLIGLSPGCVNLLYSYDKKKSEKKEAKEAFSNLIEKAL